MWQNINKTLCVSIHDVAPATWPECQRLLNAIHAVGDIPVTMLIVPQFHGNAESPLFYERALDRLLEQGHELALHGYTHLDSGPGRGSLRNLLVRTVYTQGEGEFAAIDAAEARRRLELGLAWFRRRDWPVAGFVAPAWLLGEGAWAALGDFPFEYTTTLGRFILLPERKSLLSPSLVYTARNAPGRLISRHCTDLLGACLGVAPLVRLSLHPRDARFPGLVRHFQRLLEKQLAVRMPLTKASFARRWRHQTAGASAPVKLPAESHF